MAGVQNSIKLHNTANIYIRDSKSFSSISELDDYILWIVKDYNEVRPQYKHRPGTPKEVYFNIEL